MALAQVLIDLYVYVLVADCVLPHMPELRRRGWALRIARAADASCGPVRRLLGPRLRGAPFDPSPLVVIVLLRVLSSLL